MRPSAFKSYTVGASPVLIAGASPDRRSLIMTVLLAACVISPDHHVASPNGLALTPGNMPTELCCMSAGDWITKDVYASCPAGSARLYVIEAFVSPDEIAERERIKGFYGQKQT